MTEILSGMVSLISQLGIGGIITGMFALTAAVVFIERLFDSRR